MAQILTYNQINRQQWNELVRMSETGTWFQSPEAYDFFASLPELMEPFVYGVESGGKLCAVCVGFVTKERSFIKQFFTRRAIIIGGPVLANDCLNEEVKLLLSSLHHSIISSFHHSIISSFHHSIISSFHHSIISSFHHSIISSFHPSPIYIETRNFNDFSPWKEAFESAGFSYKPHLNFHVDPSVNNLSDNRKRQLKRSDATVTEATGESDIKAWYQVLAELYRTKVKTPLWPIDFFLEAYRQGIAKFLLVKHAGRIIGGSMVVADERTVYEWFECGLNAQYKDQYPSVMATYAGIQLAHQSGCSRYDMMGAGEPGVPYGVRDFKAEFGGKLVEHGRFLCVCKPMLYRLGAWGVKLLKRK